MPEQEDDPLFASDNVVTGDVAQQVLDELTGAGRMIRLTGEAEGAECEAKVIGQLGDDLHRLLLEQALDVADNQPVLAAEEAIRFHVAKAGSCFGAYARVSYVDTSGSQPRYEIGVDREAGVYRQQRREAFRVDVEPADGVSAQLLVPDGDPLEAAIKDLSATGCRLSVDEQAALSAGLEQGQKAVLRITFSGGGRPAESQVNIAWAFTAEDGSMFLGLAWLNPRVGFTDRVEQFVFTKERLSMKRRSNI